jgi:hypothetical protein
LYIQTERKERFGKTPYKKEGTVFVMAPYWKEEK